MNTKEPNHNPYCTSWINEVNKNNPVSLDWEREIDGNNPIGDETDE